MKQPEKVSIRPQVTMLSVLKYLEYDVWFALAEFVDNAIDSYLKHEQELKEVEGDSFRLEVAIEINEAENKITIRDNAAGINENDYPRAFRPAEIPPDNTGLSEFGMGMKSAACWFSDEWSVRTTALGEDKEKIVRFDLKKIFEDRIEELDVDVKKRHKNSHYTVVELLSVNKMPRGRGLGKVKEHLKSIYRQFIRENILILKVGNEEMRYVEPRILKAPRYDRPKGEPVIWKKEISFPIESNLSVHGFVAIREKGSTSEAGFALFRRGRVIMGSYDNGFRPAFIFGNPNDFKYQRIFGELHLEGFDVSFTKKDIQWDENLDVFLKCLRDEITHDDFPLLQQAEKYRVRGTEAEYKGARKALDETVSDLQKKGGPALAAAASVPTSPEPDQQELSKTDKSIHREFKVCFNDTTWQISIELSYDPSLADLIEIADHLLPQGSIDSSTVRKVGIRLSLTHPFMIEFVGTDNAKIEPVLRIVAALGLSEVLARASGAKMQKEIRKNFNEVIANLSKID